MPQYITSNFVPCFFGLEVTPWKSNYSLRRYKLSFCRETLFYFRVHKTHNPFRGTLLYFSVHKTHNPFRGKLLYFSVHKTHNPFRGTLLYSSVHKTHNPFRGTLLYSRVQKTHNPFRGTLLYFRVHKTHNPIIAKQKMDENYILLTSQNYFVYGAKMYISRTMNSISELFF